MADFINTIDALGDEAVTDSIIDRSIVEFRDDKLTVIGHSAFRRCANMTVVDIPNVTELKPYAFYYATISESLKLPKVATIGAEAFAGATLPEIVSLPAYTGPETDNTQSIFASSTNIKHIDIPVCELIPTRFFQNCGSLESINAPKVKYIGYSAFTDYYGPGGTKLTVVDLPECTHIETEAFNKSSLLRALILRSTTACSLGGTGAFTGTPIATGTGFIYVPGNLVWSYTNATNWSTYVNQFRGIIDGDEDALQGMINETLEHWENNSVTSLPYLAFNKYTTLKSASSTTVTSLDRQVFTGCTALKSVDFPLVTSWPLDCFANCKALTDIDLSNVVGVGQSAFSGCSSLKNVNLQSLTRTSGGAFEGCAFEELYAPKLTSTSGQEFVSCQSLVKADFPVLSTLGFGTFRNCGSMRALILRNATTVCTLSETVYVFMNTPISSGTGFIYVPGNLVNSYRGATNWSNFAEQFRGIIEGDEDVLQGMIDETLVNYQNESITTIPDSAFCKYQKLESVDLPNVTTVGQRAFQGCSSLANVYFPKLTRTGQECFTNTALTVLTDAQFPELVEIAYGSFRSCSDLIEVNLTKVTEIANYNAFSGCSALMKVTLPSCTSFGYGAFGYCRKLTLVDLSAPGVITFGDLTFTECAALTALIIRSESVSNLGVTNAFTLTPIESGTGYIYVPRALIDSYKTATNWSTYADQFRALEDYTVDGTVTGDFALWSVANNLTGVSNSNAAEEAFRSYTATLTPIGDNTISEVTITMGGVDVTAEVYDPETGAINIPTVTGPIEITAKIELPDTPDTPSLDAEILYSLPESKTFNGSSDYVDTGIKLFDTAKDFTIVCSADFSTLANNMCMIHCMKEASPYPGMCVDGMQNAGVRICYTATSGGSNTISDKASVSTLAMRYKSGILDKICYKNTSGELITVTHSSTASYTATTENLILGAYQTTTGTKGRWYRGTINSFVVYGAYLSDDEIATALGLGTGDSSDEAELIYNWDFTNSLTDTVSGQTATLKHSNSGTAPTRDSSGVSLTAAMQYIDLGSISLTSRTIELDIAEFNFKGLTSAHIRFIMNDTTGKGPLIWRKTNGWAPYNGAWGNVYGSAVEGTTTDVIQYFSGKTVKLVYDSGCYPSLYVDDTFIGKSTVSMSGCDGRIYIGASPSSGDTQSAGNQCYDMTISAIRIYKGAT